MPAAIFQRLSSTLVSRVKVMAQLDIAKKRTPQDGRFSLNLGERAVDVRVSTLPSQYGERVVMRILEKTSSLLNLVDLGMGASELKMFQNAISRPNGIILVTGPTGSGKTTTLYAAISGLNDGSRNILSVEDPVEYALDGIGQTQVNTRVGMSFAAGLRCGECKEPYTASPAELSDLGITEKPTTPFYKAIGCESCRGIGYQGRVGLYEIVEMDEAMRAMIHENASEADMSSHAFRKRQTLLQSGAAVVKAGKSSAADVLRVCRANTDLEI